MPDPRAPAAAAIAVSGLSRRFGTLQAVDELTFSVEPGELFGLVGPDGAGKTTTLRMLAGVLAPSSGDAHLAGISVAHHAEAIKPRLAYMSQRFGLYTDLTVAENLAFYADLFRVPRAERAARLERLYQFSGLAPFRGRLAGQLSGGMKQKLGLSCALIHEPEILLLDEPTFGVDPVSRRDLWLIVHEMVARGVTAVVSTSYLDEAERFDRLAFLDRGRTLAIGAPTALQREFSGRLWTLDSAEPRRAKAVLAGVPAVRWAAPFGNSVHVAMATDGDAEGQAQVLAEALARAGLPPARISAMTPSLEDVFIDRVRGAPR